MPSAALVDARELHGSRTDGPWERAPADVQWWRAQSLPFPRPPIKGSSLLVPVSSLDDVVDAHREMGIPLDNFWLRAVLSPTWGSAYFFRWCGEVPALVLATFGAIQLNHVECLTRGDGQVPMPHRSCILASVIDAFAEAGFEVSRTQAKVRKSSLS
jgi:hypothetical protein